MIQFVLWGVVAGVFCACTFMAVKGLANLGLRARAEKWRRQQDQIREEFDKKEGAVHCRAEQAVHIIPFIVLGAIFILYIFSYDPDAVSLPGIMKEAAHETGTHSERSLLEPQKRPSSFQAFSVYSHRSLHEVHKQQKSKKGKTVDASLRKNIGNSRHHRIRKSNPRKSSVHRKSRILHID